MNKPCTVCEDQNWEIEFPGPVRHGTFGKIRDGVVYRCLSCGTGFLEPLQADLEEYYRSTEYRKDVGESAAAEDFFALHDPEQLEKMHLLQGLPLRNAVVADVGCGGGSFLDAVSGFAATTIAIEPAVSYHASLEKRGHEVFSGTAEALEKWRGKVQLAVSFSVIEHVEQPVHFLRGIRELLAPDGVLLISTPNKEDILLILGGDEYRTFFYRSVHIHYFDKKSIQAAASYAGFSNCDVRYQHRFSFANFTGWLREKRPTGNSKTTPLGKPFDAHWRTSLENSGTSDYLYAFLR